MSSDTPRQILSYLEGSGFTITNLIQLALATESATRNDLYENAAAICQSLSSGHTESSKAVFSWAFNTVKVTICEEIVNLSSQSGGLHFNPGQATSSDLEGSFMEYASQKMRDEAPWLWKLVGHLLDADEKRRRIAPKVGGIIATQDAVLQAMAAGTERDLGEIGGDADAMDVDSDMNSDAELDVQENGSGNVQGEQSTKKEKKKKRRKRAAERNAALLVIKAVVCISIFLQSTNERCNYLQTVLGLFYHSTSVPEKAIETLAHAGLSISLTSINKMIKSLSKEAGKKIKASVRTLTSAFAYDNFDINFQVAQPTIESRGTFVSATSATVIPLFDVVNSDLRCSDEFWKKDPRNPALVDTPPCYDANDILQLHVNSTSSTKMPGKRLSQFHEYFAWHIRDILIQNTPGFKHFSKENGEPQTIKQIPIHRTEQVPFRAMKIKESTADGNIDVVESLLRQGGLGEPSDPDFKHTEDVDISEHIILFHGDLLTKERLDSVRDSRRIEETPKRRFQFIVFVPGLFHYKMACADALWRTWIQPTNTRKDVNSLFQHAGILRPEETGKIGSKPGFRRMHDLLHHDLCASMLDCWRIEAKHDSLDSFAKSKPTWEQIVQLSEDIVLKYVASTDKLTSDRQKPESERDQVFENQMLRNRDELLYAELCHAMNAGDIGRVEETIIHWVYIFRATGKHKYATHMLQFVLDLRHFYSPKIAEIIRMNWLCNPTGKPFKFRPIDWVVERNNLYTKVIYGGSSSNRTIDRIIEESVLIELFRECHVSVENGFHLVHRTIRHSPPNMTKSLKKLSQQFKDNKPHIFKAGRKSEHCVEDMVLVGLDSIQSTGIQSNTAEEGDSEPAEIDSQDLAAE